MAFPTIHMNELTKGKFSIGLTTALQVIAVIAVAITFKVEATKDLQQAKKDLIKLEAKIASTRALARLTREEQLARTGKITKVSELSERLEKIQVEVNFIQRTRWKDKDQDRHEKAQERENAFFRNEIGKLRSCCVR